MARRRTWDTATLSQFPKWFTDRDDSLEILFKCLKREDDPKAEDIEKVFESVYVVCTEFEQEHDVKGESNIDVAELNGYDTLKEMNEALSKDWGKQEVKFVYNTRKKSFFEIETQLVIDLKEIEKEKNTEEIETSSKPSSCDPLPGLSRDTRPAANEVAPGSLGPKRSV